MASGKPHSQAHVPEVCNGIRLASLTGSPRILQVMKSWVGPGNEPSIIRKAVTELSAKLLSILKAG